MTAYVLVGGSWLGGWCWQQVARRLRDNGHDAYPLTLTGLGERVHLASPEVDAETHITDVVNLIEFEDLHDVVLLGHSYPLDFKAQDSNGVQKSYQSFSELPYSLEFGDLAPGGTVEGNLVFEV